MSSTKRKSLDTSLLRRVRPRREFSKDLEFLTGGQVNEDSLESVEDSRDVQEVDEELNMDDSEVEDPHNEASISFGALAKAQNTLARPGTAKQQVVKDGFGDTWEDNEAFERKAGRKDRRDFNRTSKHAPTEISSKKAVSRKREVVPVTKRAYRDPRFEPLAGPVDESKMRAAYSFLDDYREDEMKELKAAIKIAKDEEAKEKLKRALVSMESRRKAQLRKSKEQDILDRHRKEEKLLVKQGKRPFYLKKTEQKKRILLDQFGELKGKQLDHVIERRRKKLEGREKKKMPFARRGVE